MARKATYEPSDEDLQAIDASLTEDADEVEDEVTEEPHPSGLDKHALESAQVAGWVWAEDRWVRP